MDYLDLKITGPKRMVALGWQLGLHSGWEVFGLNLILELGRLPDRAPLPLLPFNPADFAQPLHRYLLQAACQAQQELLRSLAQFSGRACRFDVPVLHPLGNQLALVLPLLRGRPNIGVIFSENTSMDAEALGRARQFDRILAGSTWNAEILKARGVSHAVPVFQGIDPTLFHPASRGGWLKDRFVVFSGGKLEHRKGQDIVVAAFKAFRSSHPDAFLLTAWQNYWPPFMQGIDQTGYVDGLPERGQNEILQIQAWLGKNGIGAGDCFDVGFVPNYAMPQVLREADVALFTNRCEAGTNLVAMECMACGLPTVLSANTGHLDLIREPGGSKCYQLRTQGPVRPIGIDSGVEGWGESAVDEVVAVLEEVYHNRDQARERGQRAAQFMLDWTWEKQVPRLLAEVDAAS